LSKKTKKQTLSEIEADKFKRIVAAIGADTLEAIARAGPEMKAKLLAGLGLQGCVRYLSPRLSHFVSISLTGYSPRGSLLLWLQQQQRHRHDQHRHRRQRRHLHHHYRRHTPQHAHAGAVAP
jgi:hypothetical protein